MELKHRIQASAGEIFTKVVSLRRRIHANPELAFEEVQTAGLVKDTLNELGIPYTDNIAKTGVVALIQGKNPGKTIALRADMDALPILEANQVDYVSRNPGKMHACGHDVHTASLLGTAGILQQLKGEFNGTIKLIFQPSEEKIPGGASVMIQEGVLENPQVKSMLGQHVMPLLDQGKIGFRSGMYMASADEIYLTLRGKGGHGAQPHNSVDPIVAAAQLITALQTVVSRTADPRLPSVLTFGKIIGNGATNIIPNEVYIEGTFRTFDESWRTKAHEKIATIVKGISEAMGVTAELNLLKGYPVLFNDEAVTERAKNAAADYVGIENIVDLDLWMAAEDFAWYTHQVPGCFYRLGTRNEAKGITHGLHTPLFNIDEEALKTSTGLMAWMAIHELNF
jgi:amidohydrolase